MESSTSRVHGWFLQWFLVALLAMTGFGATGCSFLFVDSHRQAGNHCTTHYSAPLADWALSMLFARGVYVNATRDQRSDDVVSKEVALVYSSSLFLIAASSTIMGFGRVADCREELGLSQKPASDRRPDAARKPGTQAAPTRDGRPRPAPIPEPLKDGELPPE